MKRFAAGLCILLGWMSPAMASVEAQPYVQCAVMYNMVSGIYRVNDPVKYASVIEPYRVTGDRFFAAAYGIDGVPAVDAFSAQFKKNAEELRAAKTVAFKSIDLLTAKYGSQCENMSKDPSFATAVKKGDSFGSFVGKCAGAALAYGDYLKPKDAEGAKMFEESGNDTLRMAARLMDKKDAEDIVSTSRAIFQTFVAQSKSTKSIDNQLGVCSGLAIAVPN